MPGVKAVRDQLAKGIVGGVVLYPENIGSPNELRSLTAFLRNAKSVAGAVHRGRPGRRQGAAADAAERPQLFSLGVERRQKPELRLGRQRREALCDHGRGARLCRLQSQFRPGGRSQPQSRQSGDRPARPQLRRRSQYRHRARARLHPRPSRRRHRHRGQAFSRATAQAMSTATRRWPTCPRAGGRSSSSLTARSPRTACSTR